MVKKPPQSACVKVLKKIRKQKECIELHLFTKWRKAYMWNKTRKGAWALGIGLNSHTDYHHYVKKMDQKRL